MIPFPRWHLPAPPARGRALASQWDPCNFKRLCVSPPPSASPHVPVPPAPLAKLPFGLCFPAVALAVFLGRRGGRAGVLVTAAVGSRAAAWCARDPRERGGNGAAQRLGRPARGWVLPLWVYSPFVIFWLYCSEPGAVPCSRELPGRSGAPALAGARGCGDGSRSGREGVPAGVPAGKSWFLPGFCWWFSQRTACWCGPCQAACAPAAGMLLPGKTNT